MNSIIFLLGVYTITITFPFIFNSALLSFPVESFGFGFPSISRPNSTLALQGMLRDLNHHIPAFRTMAAITLSDWMCRLNHCIYPLDEPSVDRSFARCRHSLLSLWITAHKTLRSTGLTVPTTDQSFLFGDMHYNTYCVHARRLHFHFPHMMYQLLRLKVVVALVTWH